MLSVIVACACVYPPEPATVVEAPCEQSILTDNGAPALNVDEWLLYRDGDHFRLGALASAEVLESYPQQLKIIIEPTNEPRAVPVTRLLLACHAMGDYLHAQYSIGDVWHPAAVLGFRDDGVWIAMDEGAVEVTVNYQSMRWYREEQHHEN